MTNGLVRHAFNLNFPFFIQVLSIFFNNFIMSYVSTDLHNFTLFFNFTIFHLEKDLKNGKFLVIKN